MSDPLSARRRISPYARKLARERGIGLDVVSGSGPEGRIVAADIFAFVPKVAVPPLFARSPTPSALAASVDLTGLNAVLGQFAKAETPFELDDMILRAVGCALDDVSDVTPLDGRPGALEVRFDGEAGQLVFRDIRKSSLAPLRARRLAALMAGVDQSAEPAALSIRLLRAGSIRPVMLPLLPGRAMRLVIAFGGDAAEALLVVDGLSVDEDAASELLVRFKSYLEAPLRLLA